LNKTSRATHLLAAFLFTGLCLYGYYRSSQGNGNWRTFNILTLAAGLFAWLLYFNARRRDKREQNACDAGLSDNFPEGQAKLIDSGRLPNRYNPRIQFMDYEICHFSMPGKRLLLSPLPEGLKVDQSHLVIRFSGGNFYYIMRPQEILLPAHVDDQINGELAITNQRILFIAAENGFEVPLQSVKLLDCSAHLVDFQIRERRYTVLTDSACYAEKVLQLLLQPTGL
jgi:hypothetical protein